jgi:hypothetical protein
MGKSWQQLSCWVVEILLATINDKRLLITIYSKTILTHMYYVNLLHCFVSMLRYWIFNVPLPTDREIVQMNWTSPRPPVTPVMHRRSTDMTGGPVSPLKFCPQGQGDISPQEIWTTFRPNKYTQFMKLNLSYTHIWPIYKKSQSQENNDGIIRQNFGD